MDQDEVFERLVETCNRLKLKYFITGSMASMNYGEYRLTNDVDVVIDFRYGDVRPFLDAFPTDRFYVSEEAARAAISGGGQFNINDPETGMKIDVMIPTDSLFDETRFSRVVEEPQESGLVVRYASPEDVILMKLRYYEEGASEKHVRDIGSMLEVQGDRLDRPYLDRWVEKLGLKAAWRVVLDAWSARPKD